MTKIAASTASTGPSGPLFEGEVGAYYLLSMLVDTEPRGLPGTLIDRVELQRAAEGHPLDDVIIHAHDAQGMQAVLEIQVKRSITFSPTDTIFRSVVEQIVNASRRPEFWTSHYELAIAIARTTTKIECAYQDVLTWARQIGDAGTFTSRINRPGSANEDMRKFRDTFRSHLQDNGAPNDDETVWRLLRKLQILVFDFTAQGSASEELAKTRVVQALHTDSALQADNFWSTLIERAITIAASGGDRNRETLIDELRSLSFRFSGDRRYSAARATLAENSRLALADIDNRIGDSILTRHERLAAIHAALDENRYLEIRGDAGVGKSGLLKHFAEQIATESCVVVLAPRRTITRGWIAMRAVIGFDGTARELLTDLASNGGGILFIDNLDFFDDEEQTTVVDLLREVANISEFSVIATARRTFGIDEPSWLPSDALARLGRAEPIVIGELSELEVEEMRYAAPKLAPLLADSHPARKVTRNLFRLARLANRSGDEPFPRTEIDMAEQWWETADGKRDSEHRERKRLLTALARQAMIINGPFNVSGSPANAVNALVASETLRDLGNDRVVFHHDVLREWAIANLLHSEPSLIEQLPIDRPAPVALARGVELAARMAIERSVDGKSWQSLIEILSREGAHGTWRRAALLALVRSEVGSDLLSRASAFLLANGAAVLRELIRTALAVEVEPASKLYATVGVDPATVPTNLYVPSGPACYRLIIWLLSLEQNIPAAALPHVVALYSTWTTGMIIVGKDPLTPRLLPWLYKWLTYIESRDVLEKTNNMNKPFVGGIPYDQMRPLESDLRTTFLLSCNRTPELAMDYLRSLSKSRQGKMIARSLLKFRGSIAQAAPAELAELTASVLMQQRLPGDRHLTTDPFMFDHEFHPPSPTQGPFLQLLQFGPQHGLSLIHRLVKHAIEFYSDGSEYGTDAIVLKISDRQRAFPSINSYQWSRAHSAAHSCVTAALMALEAWAHDQVEKGVAIEKVLSDLLGPPGAPAACLLVAVDILLSHWPKSQEAAIPFLACPELLCIDRQRYALDQDLLGVQPQNVNLRLSRRIMLESLLGEYAQYGPIELREKLTVLLKSAAARLGPPSSESNLRDPAFMAFHALNVLDEKNWREVPATLPDGTTGATREYVSPEPEETHLAALRGAMPNGINDTQMLFALDSAVEDPSISSANFAAKAVEWARSLAAPKDELEDEARIRNQAIITAAMIGMRDGDAALRTEQAAWAREIFVQTLKPQKDITLRTRSGIRFNPVAVAFAGMIYLLKSNFSMNDLRIILVAAASYTPAAAHGFAIAAGALSSINERLPRAVLRCAFTSCIQPARQWGLAEDVVAARSQRYVERIEAAVNAEMTWIGDKEPEPAWPAFPEEAAQVRERLVVGPRAQVKRKPAGTRPEEYACHHTAAVWLSNASSLYNEMGISWLRDIAREYGPWTAAANGVGLDFGDEVAHPPHEWNYAYFDLLGHCLSGLPITEIDQLALEPIKSLPDETFFEVMPSFLRSVDLVYFNNGNLDESIATSIRSALAERLIMSRGWKRLGGDQSAVIDRQIGPGIAAFFFNDYNGFSEPVCYLFPDAIDRVDPFLPILKKLVESAPSVFVAMVTLNLLEVSPRSIHISFLISAWKVWLSSYPGDSNFWVECCIGQRICILLEKVLLQDPTIFCANEAIRFEVEQLLAALVSVGVADANRLERALAAS